MSGGSSLRARICALVVMVALAALAAYAMFSGPTTVAIRAPSSEPARTAPPQEEPGIETDGSRHGD